MARTVVPIPLLPEIHQVIVQPGEILKDYALDVGSLLAAGETVSSVQIDDTSVITAARGDGRLVYLAVAGPANGVQRPVRLTLNCSLGSVRHISLAILGRDPLVKVATLTPNTYLRWRGAWQPQAAYLPCDLVLYGGIVYLALSGSSGQVPDLSVTEWMAWAGSGGGGGGGSGIFPDAEGSGRFAAFRMTWIGPGKDDWKTEVVGV